MAQMTWSSYLETGHAKIDEQHRNIVEKINLLDASIGGEERREVEQLLLLLSANTKAHFRMEEELMERSQYPGAVPHRKAHQTFEEELEDLVFGYRKGTVDISQKIMDLLQDWNPMHILTEDKLLVDYLGYEGQSTES